MANCLTDPEGNYNYKRDSKLRQEGVSDSVSPFFGLITPNSLFLLLFKGLVISYYLDEEEYYYFNQAIRYLSHRRVYYGELNHERTVKLI